MLVNSSATDGSQTLAGILESDVETANGDVAAVMFLTGSFLADNLLFGGSDTVDTSTLTLASGPAKLLLSRGCTANRRIHILVRLGAKDLLYLMC